VICNAFDRRTRGNLQLGQWFAKYEVGEWNWCGMP
jgi:hypothetical protein